MSINDLLNNITYIEPEEGSDDIASAKETMSKVFISFPLDIQLILVEHVKDLLKESIKSNVAQLHEQLSQLDSKAAEVAKRIDELNIKSDNIK